MRVGIFFGGRSREREISFAGGRTVYDLLNKLLFTPVPVFVDSLGNFIELDWQYLYKGSIRDFYPPEFLTGNSRYPVYIESLNLDASQIEEAINSIGRRITPEEFGIRMDFAFLALHGPYGEDGSIQGLLDYYNIPYSGSGILPSAIGIDKITQKEFMAGMNILAAHSVSISRKEWLAGENNQKKFYQSVSSDFSLPVVVKSSTQGSSIGVSILKDWNFESFKEKVNSSFFIKEIHAEDWIKLNAADKIQFIERLSDVYEGTGIPFFTEGRILYHPAGLEKFLDTHFAESTMPVVLESILTEPKVLIEEFIDGKEFSCIVVDDMQGKPLALPPTEIVKSSSIFDYRAKYLPGISRKITPIEIPEDQIYSIISSCTQLYTKLRFDVYARIDGLIKSDGSIYLNDPNTTSGMLPSSFFFHQAAEIGLSPSQFLTYIIFQSLQARLESSSNAIRLKPLLDDLKGSLKSQHKKEEAKIKVGVILGGVSSERHISVESGRNVFEKLSSSGLYDATPVFLTEYEGKVQYYQLPMNLLLKDNADDIREKIVHFKISPVIQNIIKQAHEITAEFATANYKFAPVELSIRDLKSAFDVVFIALHGRPGEDGTLQQEFDKLKIPYNGSGSESSAITINKYITNEILKKNGMLVPEHRLISIEDWQNDQDRLLDAIEEQFTYPFIAKPADDGCSSAVKKITSRKEMANYASAIFRDNELVSAELQNELGLKPNEEFPMKTFFVVEEMISPAGADYFLEITGGMMTSVNSEGEIIYEVFEPSEALAQKGILSLEEKFLAGEGQNITPARFPAGARNKISFEVRQQLEKAARILHIEGYCRIDAFVRIFADEKIEVIFIEVNSLPGLTPATCIFHQAALNGYKPVEFLDNIIKFGIEKQKRSEYNRQD